MSNDTLDQRLYLVRRFNEISRLIAITDALSQPSQPPTPQTVQALRTGLSDETLTLIAMQALGYPVGHTLDEAAAALVREAVGHMAQALRELNA
jgi:hypothetical protein